MSIKRYIAEKDTTITNAYMSSGAKLATKSNMGGSDILEMYTIYSQISSGSLEKSRILIQFPVNKIINDRNLNLISKSGSVQFILKLSNCPHGYSTPDNLNVSISPISRSWEEGYGLDMESYTDLGFANWNNSTSTQTWNSPGGDIIPSSSLEALITLDTDDLEVDITELVEKWIDGTNQNNGLLIKLSDSQEDSNKSYYTKKFFARGTQFFFKKPWIEARNIDFIKDKRNSFYSSSPLLSEEDNKGTIYIYNNIRGNLRNIPSIGTGTLLVSFYSGSEDGPIGTPLVINGNVTSVTGGYVSTGIYSASFGITSSLEYIYDVWSDLSGNQLLTGSGIFILNNNNITENNTPVYTLTMPDLKNSYSKNTNILFKVVAYDKRWDSNIYTVASKYSTIEIIENLYYKITRIADGYVAIDYGTGSYNHTLTSYDYNGNYFNLDTSLLESGYSYKIEFMFKHNNLYHNIANTFKFRID